MCDCSGSTPLGTWGGRIGSQLGDGMHKFVKSWTGLGDYKIVYNSLINTNGEPTNFRSRGRGLVVKHKEYLGDIVTSSTAVGGFSVTKIVVNPGFVTTCPWLAPIAGQYDQYRTRGVIFEFVSTASETSTAASLGSVVMSTQYDITDADPVSKAEMLNRSYSNESKMSADCLHGLECDPDEVQNDILYTRAYASTIANARDFDFANFYVATQGGSLPVSTIVGSLYINYEFEFFKQVPNGGLVAKSNIWAGYRATTALAANVDFTGYPLVLDQGRNLGFTFAAKTMTIPKIWQGTTFMIKWYWVHSAGTNANTGVVGTMTLNNITARTETSIQYIPANYWLVAPLGGTGLVTGFSFTLLLTVNPNINTDATVVWGSTIGNWPSVSPGAQTSIMDVEVVVVPSTFTVVV